MMMVGVVLNRWAAISAMVASLTGCGSDDLGSGVDVAMDGSGRPDSTATIAEAAGTDRSDPEATLVIDAGAGSDTGGSGGLAFDAPSSVNAAADSAVPPPTDSADETPVLVDASLGGSLDSPTDIESPLLDVSPSEVSGPPGVVFTPSSLSLGTVGVGQTVTASVGVNGLTHVEGLSITAQGSGLQIQSSTSCGSMLPGDAIGSCRIDVRFDATAEGPFNGAILIAQDGWVKAIPVTATVGPVAKLVVTPSSVSVTAPYGGESGEQQVYVSNNGQKESGRLTVDVGGKIADSFRIIDETCSLQPLAPGAQCVVTLVYVARTWLNSSAIAMLSISDAGPPASSIGVNLVGSPILLLVTGGPSLGSVAPGAMGEEVIFTVTNLWTVPTGPLSTLVGDPAVQISSDVCGTMATLNQNDSCTIGLRLAPSRGSAAQSISTNLTVRSANVGGSASVTGNIVGM